MESSSANFNEKSPAYLAQRESMPTDVSTAVARPEPALISSEMPSTSSNPNHYDSSYNARAGLPQDISLAAIFRYHMGIEHDTSLVPSYLAQMKAIDPIATKENAGRRAVNLGIYNRAIREERTCARQYSIWKVVINGALGLQIVFAAILTALGAGNGPADAVAAFGTLNTIIAGFLTYLKGTGLPMRMKYFHNQWLKLRAYIEQRERDFASDDHTKTHRIGYQELMEEIEIIEKMYQNIRKDVERHTPDSFGGNKGDSSQNHGPGEGAPIASFASKGLHALRERLTGVGQGAAATHNDMESRVKGMFEDVEKRLSGHITKLEGHTSGGGQGGGLGARQSTTLGGEKSKANIEDDMDEVDSSPDVVGDMEMEHMRKTQARALEAQRQAELRVKELEERLAATNK